ncbi:DNA-directed RNA polymerase [Rhizoclosmatium sp. JEL0117]|nr:DNA-directed RNA polymerase [Rhizoclosmatium sp. JEL0117]
MHRNLVLQAVRHVSTAAQKTKGSSTSEATAAIVANALSELDALSPSLSPFGFGPGPTTSASAPTAATTEAPSKRRSDGDLAAALFPRSSGRVVAQVPQQPIAVAQPQILASTNQNSSIHKFAVAPADAAFVLSERFALIAACLNSGDTKRAETLFHRTVRIFRASFLNNANSETADLGGGFVLQRGMVNAFVDAYLNSSSPNLAKALEWHNRAKAHKLAPDVSTYASLIHHFLISQNDVSAATRFILDMKADGLEPTALFGDHRFADMEDCAALSAVIRNIKGLNIDLSKVSDENQISDMILKSAKDGLSDSARKAGTSTTSVSASGDDALVLSAMKDSKESASPADTPTIPPAKDLKYSDLVETDSLGVKILRKTLASLSLNTKDDSLAEKLKLQSLLEEKALSAAAEEFAASHENLPDSLKSVAHLPSKYMANWNKLLVPAIKKELEKIEADTKDADQHLYLPFLKLLSPEQLAKITITEFCRLTHQDGSGQGVGESSLTVDGGATHAVATASVLSRIGAAIETEYNLQQLSKKKNQKMLQTQIGIHNLHMNGRLFNKTMRSVVAKLAQQETAKNEKDNWIPEWPSTVQVRAGSVLAVLFIQLAKIRAPHPDPKNPQKDIYVEEAAFQHGYTYVGTKKHGIIKMHPFILERLANDPVHVQPRLLPMVVPPRPWLTRNSGGYLHYRSDVLRTRSNEHMAYIEAADKQQHLSGVYESLDVLGKTAWKVNEKVYNRQEEKEAAKKRAKKPDNWDEMDGKARKAWVTALQKEEAIRRNNFSQRCDVNYKIEIARSFLGQTIYFPHNVDFRGRAYPIPAHLNHMGNDFCRGLLMFSNRKPLGERGLKWLKIQVANLMGNNKISFDERAKYAEDHIDDIMDSADKPLEGKRWWLTAEDPWQMLATCFELTEALRSPNPLEYCSGVAVHQDGTCNGLQHYAALGGDHLGAAQVNLVPSDKPGDIYSAVANIVSATVDKQAAEGHEIALLMKGKITRKLVKQTVMTNTYGVTFVGARAQVKSRIREQPELYPFTDDQINQCSLHITHLIFDSLGELFTGARALQNWLNSTASMIAKSIPATSIPKVQLDDAAFLNKIGCLPSPFTVARAEVKDAMARERAVDEKAAKNMDSASLSMDEFNKQLLDAVLEEESAEPEPVVENAGFEEDEGVAQAIAAVDSAAVQAESEKKIEKMASVIWTTPLGLPIVQPYRAIKTRTINTLLQTVTIRDNTVEQAVNPMKQSTAFPPNFIHSLDATHMMLSAIACNQAGIDFAAVHDSYWTHACDIDTMSVILRDTFVKLHSKDIMINLRKELQERNGNHKFPVTLQISDPEHLKLWTEHLRKTGRTASAGRIEKAKGPVKRKVNTWVDLVIPPLPAKGDFDIENVKKSPYFFH